MRKCLLNVADALEDFDKQPIPSEGKADSTGAVQTPGNAVTDKDTVSLKTSLCHYINIITPDNPGVLSWKEEKEYNLLPRSLPKIFENCELL